MKRWHAAAAACVAATALAPESALAFGKETTAPVKGEIDAKHAGGGGDGVYGRLDGDLDVGVGVGVGYDGDSGDLGLGSRLTLHYFSIAGIYVDYRDALRAETNIRRTLGFGADLRPLFVPRWSMNLEQGPAFADLTLDSLSLAIGAFFAQPDGEDFADERGFAASLGFGLPLTSLAAGPWLELRGAVLWPDTGDARAVALALFSWHFIASTPFNRIPD